MKKIFSVLVLSVISLTLLFPFSSSIANAASSIPAEKIYEFSGDEIIFYVRHDNNDYTYVITDENYKEIGSKWNIYLVNGPNKRKILSYYVKTSEYELHSKPIMGSDGNLYYSGEYKVNNEHYGTALFKLVRAGKNFSLQPIKIFKENSKIYDVQTDENGNYYLGMSGYYTGIYKFDKNFKHIDSLTKKLNQIYNIRGNKKFIVVNENRIFAIARTLYPKYYYKLHEYNLVDGKYELVTEYNLKSNPSTGLIGIDANGNLIMIASNSNTSQKGAFHVYNPGKKKIVNTVYSSLKPEVERANEYVTVALEIINGKTYITSFLAKDIKLGKRHYQTIVLKAIFQTVTAEYEFETYNENIIKKAYVQDINIGTDGIIYFSVDSKYFYRLNQ